MNQIKPGLDKRLCHKVKVSCRSGVTRSRSLVGQVDEEKFLVGVKRLPADYLDYYLNFQILPEEMKERLHKNLQEVWL